MSESEVCICGKRIDWECLMWNISIVKGYKTREFVCGECGHEMTRCVPTSTEKIKLWQSIDPRGES